ncbi:MAG: signal peptidase I [Candidatus Odinarchaeum yellowstonii]|uniref:Signal peptidase I n=1 Tax=Odinarchaeota yellowstonii (strain LCB_4) TaxID=1841599 RepID=A0AAF0D2C6_ODILC|nr:MAG: signal peptidase I [Candidatus Odinarchaeum yellowstonii]
MTDIKGEGAKNLRKLIKPVAAIVLIISAMGIGYLSISTYLGSSAPIVVVTSESMHPVYWEGDILFVKYATPEEITIGTDIVFHATWIPESDPNANIPVVHRVIDKQLINGEWYFWTQGVNSETNPYPDPAPTPYSNVIGKVVFTIPRIGLPLVVLRPIAGYIQYLLITVIILLIAYILYDYYKPSEKTNPVKKEETMWTEEELKETERITGKERKNKSEE